MALLAYRADTGEEVESFSTPADTWMTWRAWPLGTFVIGRERRVPAVLKRSIRGLQFFAAAPGYGGVTAPESIEHQMAKVFLVRGLRAAGFDARVEHPGRTPSGEEWQADVFVQTPTHRIAIEVQLARQHWDDYRHRTARYAASGVNTIWLVRSTFWLALGKSRVRHLMTTRGLSLDQAMNHALEDMPCFVLELSQNTEDLEGMRVVANLADGYALGARLPLETFGAGVAAGAIRFGEIQTLEGRLRSPAWLWDQTRVPVPAASLAPGAVAS